LGTPLVVVALSTLTLTPTLVIVRMAVDDLAGHRQVSAMHRTIACVNERPAYDERAKLMSDIITRYLDCWNETDPAARRALVRDVFATDASYVDPLAEARGVEAIDATIGAVQAQFPEFVFSGIGVPDAHHDQVRFSWGLGPAGAEPPIVGFDVAVTDADGRITTVLGFLDKVPG
jgi:hypothetical protein